MVALLMEKSGKIIKSNRVDLEVYEHLSSIPLEILVSPGCESTLQIVGGPVDRTKFSFKFIDP